MSIHVIYRRDRGAGLILAMVFVAILASFAAFMLTESSNRARGVFDSVGAAENRLLAETAMTAALTDLNAGGTGIVGTANWTTDADGNGLADWLEVEDLANGPVQFSQYRHYWAQIVDVAEVDTDGDTITDKAYRKIIGYGRVDPGVHGRVDTGYEYARYEMVVMAERDRPVHDAFTGKYGVWVGGGEELIFKGRSGGGPENADRVFGDVYVHGDLKCLAASTIYGDSYATGAIRGHPPTGTRHPNWPRIIPPDFTQLKDKCDVHVGDAFKGSTWTRAKGSCASTERQNIVDAGVLTVPKDNPAHIFAKESFTPEAMGGVTTGADNYQLGDWVSSNDGETIKVYKDGNHKSYFVPGNLWIDPQGYGPTFGLGDSTADDGVQITIIVEGNVYVGDEIYYEGQTYDGTPEENDPKLNGVAIIAVKARDEFGDPVDRPEGSGNILFGDLNRNVRPLKVNSILMAENEFLDKVTSDGVPIEFTLNGLMACGGDLDLIERGLYANYAPMTVRHDARLSKPVGEGGISLPNLPTSAVPSVSLPFVPPWKPIMRWRGGQPVHTP